MTVPVLSTYRVQLHPGFDFAAAVGILDHLERLGITHLYTSPVLEAVTGSTHGYDVTDPTTVRAELGGEAGLEDLVAQLRSRGMGWIVDIVPNHQSVAVPRENPRWWDVLGEGRTSASARWFDIDWDAGDGRIVLPILGQPLDDEIDDGGLAVIHDGGDLVLDVRGTQLPLADGTTTDDDVGAGRDRIREIVHDQHHRPSFWRAGDRNYRVFFDIDALAGVRVEDDVVFDDVHERVADWVERDLVDGVRVDHVDGLVDPAGYLDRLRSLIGDERRLWVEKILLPGEDLPTAWPVDGTTGYDFARVATAVGVDRDAQAVFDDSWRSMGGEPDYEPIEEAAKRAALHAGLGPEVRRTVATARSADPGLADVDPAEIESVLIELAVGHPVYRTYGVGMDPLDETDALRLEASVAHAGERLPESAALIERLATVLRAPTTEAAVELRSRFQQLAGPAMAKGAEDTAFYRYHRLTALSEVGGEPSRFGLPASALADRNRTIAERWPATMLAASTHDTKRSADVRARITALTHRPEEWRTTLADLRTASASYRPQTLDGPTEVLLWQTLAGAWPIDADRVGAYLEKATRESGAHTSWTDPDERYESDLGAFARTALADPTVVAAVERLVSSVDPIAQQLRLGEVVLRMTSPGVPDTYQGDQDHDRSLVDPDNRRPVDHAEIADRLERATAVADVDQLGVAAGSLAKLWVTHRLLALRFERPDSLGPGGVYELLAVAGGEHRIVAHRRGDVVAVADVHPGTDLDDELTITLPSGRWSDVLRADRPVEGGRVRLRDLWDVAPVAVLVRSST